MGVDIDLNLHLALPATFCLYWQWRLCCGQQVETTVCELDVCVTSPCTGLTWERLRIRCLLYSFQCVHWGLRGRSNIWQIQIQNPDHPRMPMYQKWTWSMTWPSSSVKPWLQIKRLTMALLSLPQLLILFDHLLLAVLFIVALFCILAAVTSNMQVPLSTWGNRWRWWWSH